MITTNRFFSVAALLLFCLAAVVPAAQDSGDAGKIPEPEQSVQSAEDEELILDEPAALVPEAKPPAEKTEITGQEKTPGTPDSPASKDTGAAKNNTATTIVDEDLILEGGAEDLLGQERPVPDKKAVAAKPVTGVDSVSTSPSIDSSAAAGAVSDTGAPQAVKPLKAAPAFSTTAITPQPGPAEQKTTIEKVRSIDFGANLKEYRSPKLAMLMSLILPGSGQVYAQSNLLAAGFLALEAVVFGTGYAFVAKGQKQKKNARIHADSLYDAAKFNGYCEDLRSFLAKQFSQEKAESIYLDSIFYGDSTVEQGFLENARKKNDDYYDDLLGESSIYIRGWKDVSPLFSGDNGFEDIDTTVYRRLQGDTVYLVAHQGNNDRAFGFSENQAHYIDLVNQSQSSARIGRNFYMSLLVNHIASAVMAGILAKKHNDAMLGEQSLWQRIDVEPQQVNTGSHTINGYALQVRF